MKRLIYWIKNVVCKDLRQCKSCCLTCRYYEVCRSEFEGRTEER